MYEAGFSEYLGCSRIFQTRSAIFLRVPKTICNLALLWWGMICFVLTEVGLFSFRFLLKLSIYWQYLLELMLSLGFRTSWHMGPLMSCNILIILVLRLKLYFDMNDGNTINSFPHNIFIRNSLFISRYPVQETFVFILSKKRSAGYNSVF